MAGVERFVCNLATELDGEQFEVAVAINEGRLAADLQKANVPIYLFRSSKRNPFQFFLEWKKIVRDFKPHIVHSHHRYTSAIAQMTPCRAYRLVHTVHNEYHDKRFLRFYGDQIVTVSVHLKNYMMNNFSIPAHKIKVIYGSVRLPQTDPPPHEFFENKKPGDLAAVVVGRLEEQKGHRYLIEALALLSPEMNRRLKVVFVGTGSKRQELEALAKQKSVHNLQFVGFQEDAYGFIRAADFTIQPSLWEGLGVFVLESYYYSKPVIATALEAVKELVQDRVTGILVPPHNPEALAKAIRTYFEHPQWILDHGAAGKKCVAEFRLERILKEHEDLYLSRRPS